MYKYKHKQKLDDVKHFVNTVDPITGESNIEPKMKSSIAIQAEKQAVIAAKTAEIQSKVDAYIAAQAAQGVGNPAPVAEFEIMKIVNEHNGEFTVVLEE